MGSAVQAEAAASALTRLTGLPTVRMRSDCGSAGLLAVILGGIAAHRGYSGEADPGGMRIIDFNVDQQIIFGNIPLLGAVFGKIFAGAADISAAGGGIFGFTLSRVVSVGVTDAGRVSERGGVRNGSDRALAEPR